MKTEYRFVAPEDVPVQIVLTGTVGEFRALWIALSASPYEKSASVLTDKIKAICAAAENALARTEAENG